MRRVAVATVFLALTSSVHASLEEDGVWAAGVWATTVWADGVWQEDAPPVSAPNNRPRTISIGIGIGL